VFKGFRSTIIALLVILGLFISGCTDSAINTSSPPAALPEDAGSRLVVHFIDVGQGDSQFLQLPNGQTMLIDAGTNEKASEVVSYLNRLGVKTIDYLIATHPHEDHIGGMDEVINHFEIGNIYMPQVTHNTKSFESVLKAIKAKGKKITAGKAGLTILDQEGLKISFLAPCGQKYEDLNNWSIVTRVEFGNTSFLFTGDAEELSESEILESGQAVSADVLKVGHHGSRSSTSTSFLKAVAPKYAVISAGKDNSYGHPHEETLKKLKQKNITVYRTDINGTIILFSDGRQISQQ